MSTRRGFTLIELLVVAVVGVLLVLATYQVLVVNQRTYTVQNEQVRAQQSTRAALDILFNELREVSSRGGDILGFDDDSIAVRVMRKFGIVCGINDRDAAEYRVRPIGSDSLADNDSVFVFADNDDATTSDDVWIPTEVEADDNGVTCASGGFGAIDLRFREQDFDGDGDGVPDDSVRAGAPVRSFERYTYGLFEVDGETYLGRRAPGGDVSPLVGPLIPATQTPKGLEFSYFDQNGVAAVNATDIREIRVVVRTISDATKPTGEQVRDSITASIYTRN